MIQHIALGKALDFLSFTLGKGRGNESKANTMSKPSFL